MRITRILITLGGLLGIWSLIVWATDLPKFILPTPVQVFFSFVNRYDIIFEHALTTATEIILSLIIGIALGIISALLISMHRPARQWIMPVLIASQAVPVFAIAPLLVLWLDYGMSSKIVMATLIIYFPVTVNFLDGLNRTPPTWMDLSDLMQQSQKSFRFIKIYRQYRFIRVPFALPALASGMRIATAVAPIGAVVGEWVGSSSGLGYLMLHANGRMQTDLLFASLFTLTLMAISLYYLMDYLLRHALSWQPDNS
ncbi:ABC transporter permease [Sneathiella aquimaris]|uniref:ABC transporter permease n=1 Tax=Sneathiella aquimaris TaxID=2599305 RepID=UPI00146E7394|nr:ABC transporter permease [Sneathiella aquimaris]